MANKILALLILSIITFLVAYVFYLNPEPMVVKFGPERVVEGPVALVLLITFFLGIFATALVAFYFATKTRFSLWLKSKKIKTLLENEDLLATGSSQMSCKEYKKAETSFEKLIAREPNNLIARVLLAKSQQSQGHLKNALETLDNARIEQKKNVELLLLVSELNEKLGNITAAIDNLHILLKQTPSNLFALAKLRDNALLLKRFDEAITAQKDIARLSNGESYKEAQTKLAAIETQKAKETITDNASLAETLQDILKKHKECPEALRALAELHKNNNNFELAAKHFLKAFKSSLVFEDLENCIRTELSNKTPSQAITIATDVLKLDLPTALRTQVKLLKVELMLHLGMVDDADSEIETMRFEIEEKSPHYKLFLLLKAEILSYKGLPEKSWSLMKQACSGSIKSAGLGRFEDLEIRETLSRKVAH